MSVSVCRLGSVWASKLSSNACVLSWSGSLAKALIKNIKLDVFAHVHTTLFRIYNKLRPVLPTGPGGNVQRQVQSVSVDKLQISTAVEDNSVNLIVRLAITKGHSLTQRN
jgi:hypothetical protein